MQAQPNGQLIEYRVNKLEEAVSVLSEGFSEIAQTVRGAKWAIVLIFGVMQPVAVGLLVHWLTN